MFKLFCTPFIFNSSTRLSSFFLLILLSITTFYWVDPYFIPDLQICVTTSTSAGLEQILPWMFYHKVIGVTNFFLFVEGKAASPEVSKVLESIPVSKNKTQCVFGSAVAKIDLVKS